LEKAQQLGVRYVRRPTGGRAVVHSEDLTYAFVAGDAQKEGLGTSLKETYRQIARALTSGFTRLGLPVAFSFKERLFPGKLAEAPLACFLSLSNCEISVHGKKLVGSAQRREGNSFLQHGSIPLNARNRRLAEQVLSRSAATESPDLVSNFRSRYATVEEAAGRRISVKALLSALLAGFGEVFDVEFEAEELSGRQWAAVQNRATGFAFHEWNERTRPAAGAR
jgi:lipoate-protein ligase A